MLHHNRTKATQQYGAQRRQYYFQTSIAALLKWDPSMTSVEKQPTPFNTAFEDAVYDTPFGFSRLDSATLVNQEFVAVERKFNPVQAFYYMLKNTIIETAEAEMASRRHKGQSASVDIDMLRNFIKVVGQESETLYKAKDFDFAGFNEDDERAHDLNTAYMYEKLIDMEDQTVLREFGKLITHFRVMKTEEYENFLKYWFVNDLKHLDLEERDEQSKMIAYESNANDSDDQKRLYFVHEPIVHYNGKLYSDMTDEEQNKVISAGSTIRVRSEAYNEIAREFFKESNREILEPIEAWSTGLCDKVDDGEYHGPPSGPAWPLYLIGVYIFGFRVGGDQPEEQELNQFVTINGIDGGMSLKHLHRYLSAISFAEFETAWGRIYVESK